MSIKIRPAGIQFLASILGLFVLFFASPVAAYVLSGAQIIEQMQKKLGKAKNLEIDQKLFFYDSQLENGAIELDETVKYYFPDRFRSDIVSDNTRKMHLASFDQALMVLDGKVASEYESGFDHYKDLILFRSRIMLEQRLTMLGLDLGATCLERYKGRIVFAIGDKNADGAHVPRLFIDKETFLPVKWVLGTTLAGEQTESLEVFYFNWKKFKKSIIPGRIEFYRDKKLVREIQVKNVVVNPEFDEALFDFQGIKASCALKENEAADESGGDDDNEARKTIDGLDKIIETDQLAF